MVVVWKAPVPYRGRAGIPIRGDMACEPGTQGNKNILPLRETEYSLE